eukprot:950810-Rhodomonas_salina.1
MAPHLTPRPMARRLGVMCLLGLSVLSLPVGGNSGSVWGHAPLGRLDQACSSLGPRAPYQQQLASIPHFPASVPPLAFLDEQKAAIGEYFTENWERCKAGFSGVWADWNYAREIEQRNRNGEPVTFSEKCHLIRNRQDVGK